MQYIGRHDFNTLYALFKPLADKLTQEGVAPDTIARRFYQYCQQKMSQQRAREMAGVLEVADKAGI